eukprot:scaffold42317_cov82-Phaeocystis_antarctica.AAC.1
MPATPECLKPTPDLAQCAPFAEYEVPLRLGVQEVPCQVLPPNTNPNVTANCYDPAKYSFGVKSSRCQAQKAKHGDALFAANAGQSYPPRLSLSDELELRVTASCVPYVPEAQGPKRHALYVQCVPARYRYRYQPRACRTYHTGDETLDQLCYATTCMDGFNGPLLDPVVFEHLVEISTNCLLTPVQ